MCGVLSNRSLFSRLKLHSGSGFFFVYWKGHLLKIFNSLLGIMDRDEKKSSELLGWTGEGWQKVKVTRNERNK